VVVTADEEISGGGAKQVGRESVLFNGAGLRYGVIAEPTRLIPVYAHKGGVRLIITAHGRAAHSSTVEGINANFLIAPFLAEMAELQQLFLTDDRHMNRAFDPPTNGWNMVLTDGNTAANVTAAQSTCTISFRPMPGDHTDEIIEMVREKAAKYGLEFRFIKRDPFIVPRDSPVVQAALEVTGRKEPETVAYGTDALSFGPKLEPVVLGPGDIRQAHTIDEFVSLQQLHDAVEVYNRMIQRFCT
jgi:acetylornithine deacetylase